MDSDYVGFRMYIDYDGKTYGGDHKFYGFVSLAEIPSFYIIVPEIIKQWNIPYNVASLWIYYFNFAGPVTSRLILGDDTFSKFADQYIKDLVSCFGDVPGVESYMRKLSNSPGDKIIYWH